MRTKLRALAALLVLAAWTRADAFPAFARKYGMSCSACHDAWPILNPVGVNFRDNGYQFRLGKDAPTELKPEYVPIAIRTTPQYAFTRKTNQTADSGPVKVRSAGIDAPGVDVLTGGTISENLSFLMVLAGFVGDEPAGIESAWARINRIGGSSWLNLRVGKMELDLPASAHRGISLTSGYAVYGAHPMNSAVGFDLSENQVGVELSGHDARSYSRYALSLVNTNGGGGLSSNGWSSPLVYGHFQQTFAMESPILPFVRIGALGALGWWPTRFELAAGEPIPGTGTDHRQFYRVGGELSATFGYPATPFIVTAVVQHGREAVGLASAVDPVSGLDLATVANTFDGGFVEVDWVPFAESTYVGTPWVIFAKWDVIRYDHGAGNHDGGTLGVRRYLAMGPRASAAIHLEVHADRVRRSGEIPDETGSWVDPVSGIGRDVVTQSAMLGIDFDF